MGRGRDARRAEALALAHDLTRLASNFRDCGPIDQFLLGCKRDFERARARLRDLDREMDGELDRVCARRHARNLDRRADLPHSIRGKLFLDEARANDLERARALDCIAVSLAYRYAGAEGRLLSGLARFLPAGERFRFVAEALGNLDDCNRRWQQVDHIVRLAIGTPRLAWMMRRGSRRDRAR